MNRRNPKPGHLGDAFYEWLAHLEKIEKIMVDGWDNLDRMRHKPAYWFNDALFPTPERGDSPEGIRLIREMGLVDASIAAGVRSSVKYKVSADALAELAQRYPAQLKYVIESYPLSLPYPQTTLVIDDVGAADDTAVIFFDERDLPSDYTQLGLKKGDRFICANLCLYRSKGISMMEQAPKGYAQKPCLSHVPLEWHAAMGETIINTDWLMSPAPGSDITPMGQKVMKLLHGTVVAWLAGLHVAGVLRTRRPGRPPKVPWPAPRHLSKKHKHPLYEHLVVELEMDQPEPEQTGRTANQPRKRLHQVRSFMRHYRSGKIVKVDSHWRGDERLGVIRKDMELTVHGEKVK